MTEDIGSVVNELRRIESLPIENIDFEQAGLDALRACCEALDSLLAGRASQLAADDARGLASAILHVFEKYPASTGCGLFNTLGMVLEEMDLEHVAPEIAASRARKPCRHVEELAETLDL